MKTIDIIKKKLKDIPIISNNHINIYRSSDLREKFNLNMLYKMTINVEKMSQYILTLKYPQVLFDSILKQIQTASSIIEKQIEYVVNQKMSVNHNEQYDDQNIQNIEKQIKECEYLISGLETQISDLDNAKDEDIEQHIQSIDNKELVDLQTQKENLEKYIVDLSQKIADIGENLKNEIDRLNSFEDNYNDALKEKQSMIKHLKQDIERTRKYIYDTDHIIEDFENLDPVPVFQNSINDDRFFKNIAWEVNFDQGIIYDYKNPQEKMGKKVKRIVENIDETHFHVKYMTEKQLIKKVLYVDIKLYTWKKYREENKAYIRTKKAEKESYLIQNENDQEQLEIINADLNDFIKSNEVLRKVLLKNKADLNQQKEEVQKELTATRASLEKCKAQFEIKKRKYVAIEKQNMNAIEQINKEREERKKDMLNDLQALTNKKEQLLKDKKIAEENKIKSHEEFLKNMKIEEEKRNETKNRLSKFNIKLEAYKESIETKSKIITSFYTEKTFDQYEADLLVLISTKLMINQVLCSEIKRIEGAIRQAKSQNMFSCETINTASQINPELDQNIWVTNNITKQKTSIFCFIQEMESDINIYEKWVSESKLFEIA